MHYIAELTQEDDSVIVEFPDCPGALTQVDPGEDLEEMATDALVGWLELELAEGRVPPRPSAEICKGRMAIAIPVELAFQIQLLWSELKEV